MVPVQGKVTFDGGPPPAEGGIFFAPVEVAAGLPRRPGMARFGMDGQFTVTSFSGGDGLVPGTYRVNVECWKVPPTMETPGESYVADDYHPADVKVAPDAGSVDVPLDVRKK